MRVVAIMQPTYLPWLGYFDLIDEVDVFVLLDSVQFCSRSWQQRNRIKTPRGPQWLSVPVFQHRDQRIDEAKICNDDRWREQHWNAIRTSYGKSPFWSQHAGALEAIYAREWDSLVSLNQSLIELLCSHLSLKTPIVRSSTLPPPETGRVGALIHIVQHVGGSVYLSPAGSRVYIGDDAMFNAAGIELLFQNYEHPVYPQLFGAFEPHMSAVDALMNLGPDTAEVMRSGRRPPKTATAAANEPFTPAIG